MDAIIGLLCVIVFFLVGGVITLLFRVSTLENVIKGNNIKIVNNIDALWKCAQESKTKRLNIAQKVSRLEKEVLNFASYVPFEG